MFSKGLGFLSAGIGIIAVVTIVVVASMFPSGNNRTTAVVMAGEKSYNDDGSGVLIIYSNNPQDIKKGYLQWKKDYPDRARKVITSAMNGRPTYLILIYKTEK
jgi:hypothetical protein